MKNSSGRIRIFIVDDHPLVREGLSGLIADEPDLEVCGQAADAMEAMRKLDQLHPDCVVVDISLGGTNGIDLIEQVHERDGKVKFVVLSMYDELLFVERALRAGALGYLSKRESAATILAGIRAVASGHSFLSEESNQRVFLRMREGRKNETPLEALSDRELEIFELIGCGHSTREIAVKLNIGIKTVETHRLNIKTKLALKDGLELVQHAVLWRLETGAVG